MNDELSDDIKKKFLLPLTIELQDHKEKCFVTPLSNFLLSNLLGSFSTGRNFLRGATISFVLLY